MANAHQTVHQTVHYNAHQNAHASIDTCVPKAHQECPAGLPYFRSYCLTSSLNSSKALPQFSIFRSPSRVLRNRSSNSINMTSQKSPNTGHLNIYDHTGRPGPWEPIDAENDNLSTRVISLQQDRLNAIAILSESFSASHLRLLYLMYGGIGMFEISSGETQDRRGYHSAAHI